MLASNDEAERMRKILAIDDNSINLELLSQIVKLYYPDFKFISALSGKKGISIAQKENPDLILLDIMMPDMDGYETCRLLKQQSKTKQIPIIMVSALGRDSVERTKGLNVGADSFISKPFDQVELKAQINVALRIKSYQVQLKKLNSELTLIEERERRRIAENLHDSLGQTLGLAFMNLSSIDVMECQPKVKQTIQFTSKLLNKAIEESRRLTYDLSPPILYELGLIPAIKWKLEQFEKDFNIRTSLIIGTPNIQLSKEHNIFLYRTIGELLANTHKHAEASNISVKQAISNSMYYISVEDDGKGFDKSKVKAPSDEGGFGLLSISERIENMNGNFKIEASPKGTLAEIEIPYITN